LYKKMDDDDVKMLPDRYKVEMVGFIMIDTLRYVE
jgi:hypothetical protein